MTGSAGRPTTTRTLGPLHLEDVDPYRFEDLVRQLAYGFKSWAALEAIGRSGDDGGVDIRGIENSTTHRTPVTDVSAGVDEPLGGSEEWAPGPDRVWLIQVKRYRKFTPKNARDVVAAAVFDDEVPPVGFIVAVAADVSRTARRELAAGFRARGVAQVLVWGRGELEDMLFDPQYDHLLFAYFGVSLQVRKRALATALRADHSIKRQVFRALGGLDVRASVTTPVLLRDPIVAAYPFPQDVDDWDPANPPWMWTAFNGHRTAGGVVLTFRRHHAWWTANDTYDVLEVCSHPLGTLHNSPGTGHGLRSGPLFGVPPAPLPGAGRDAPQDGYLNGDPDGDGDVCARAWQYAYDEMPQGERAWVTHLGILAWEDIALVDELGDPVSPPPHLLVTRDHAYGLFRTVKVVIETEHRASPGSLSSPPRHRTADPTTLRRTELFPATFPPVRPFGSGRNE